MERRILGRTGIPVSKLCLGAMMFGAWGNEDRDESIRIIERRSRPGSTSSTPRMSTLAANPKRSSAGPCRAGAATMSSWRPRHWPRSAMVTSRPTKPSTWS